MRLTLLLLVLMVGCAADSPAGDAADSPASSPPDGLIIGTFEEVAGAGHLRAELRPSPQRGYSSRGETYGGPVRNVLFYDIAEREGRWLFSDSRRAILSQQTVGDSGRVRAFVYVVAEADTDGDDRIDGEDRRSLAVSDPGGRRIVRVAEGVERLRRIERIDDNTVLLLYDGDSGLGGVEVGIDALRVEARAGIPPVPPAD